MSAVICRTCGQRNCRAEGARGARPALERTWIGDAGERAFDLDLAVLDQPACLLVVCDLVGTRELDRDPLVDEADGPWRDPRVDAAHEHPEALPVPSVEQRAAVAHALDPVAQLSFIRLDEVGADRELSAATSGLADLLGEDQVVEQRGAVHHQRERAGVVEVLGDRQRR